VISTPHEPVAEFADLGVTAFTTTRDAGTFSLASDAPVGEVMQRWTKIQTDLAGDASGIVIAPQVHGTTVIAHATPWEGFLRTRPADGHATLERGLALAVTVADCVPIFLVHPPTGAVALLHSGWRGTAGNILNEGIRTLSTAGIAPDELHVHLGPAICGRCYEVSADVRSELLGTPATRSGHVDLRSLIAAAAQAAGVRHISVSPYCTRCDNDRFFSHRAGDAGRQIAVICLNR
jgi:YfiH family protein